MEQKEQQTLHLSIDELAELVTSVHSHNANDSVNYKPLQTTQKDAAGSSMWTTQL